MLAVATILAYALVYTPAHAAEFSHGMPQPYAQMFVEVARTKAEQEKGLSGRKKLDDDHIMLFVFEKPLHQCMWNAEVNFPLEVHFFDAYWHEQNVEYMPAKSTTPACPFGRIKYVIETNPPFVDRRLR